ncbi:hypothetical protein PAHAL_5G341500 [Panicum hallii]|uniref:Uncharacterized protein n=1 Tax=Panicum hallii TaxID=206008 RepID=A0A2T8IM42_9POAL|nr:hypothetical protein PAHAL_5G341500 [Panicum hallii]
MALMLLAYFCYTLDSCDLFEGVFGLGVYYGLWGSCQKESPTRVLVSARRIYMEES